MKLKSKQRLIAASKKKIQAKAISTNDYMKVVKTNIVKYASVLKELEDK